jgi:hypothetical protein
VTIYLPLATSDGIIEIAGIHYTAAREFGQSLFRMLDSIAKLNGNPDWFANLQATWAEKNIKVWEDPTDPRALLNEALFSFSPIRQMLPGVGYEWDKQAKKLVKELNKFGHQGIAPTITKLLDVLYPMRAIASMSYLDIEDDIAASVDRLKQIRDGVYFPEEAPAQVSVEAAEWAKEVEEKVLEIKKRPPIGHRWEGAKGKRKVDIDAKTRDVTENGASIRAELGSNPDEKITAWLRIHPKSGELHIDDDGAVMAYDKGLSYLVGWLGEEPKQQQDEIRGFFLDHEYVFEGDDIRDLDTEELLSEVADEPIDVLINALKVWGLPKGSLLNITIYGELVFETATGQTRNITIVHQGIWFPGQLEQAS